jgi:hypothetical protein
VLLAAVATLAVLVLYGAVNLVLSRAVRLDASILAAFLLLAVLQLGVAVPSSPGRIGVFHYLSVQVLALFDVPRAPAMTYAILLHAISVGVPVALAALLAPRLGLSLRSLARAERGG